MIQEERLAVSSVPQGFDEVWPRAFPVAELRAWLGDEADELLRDVVTRQVNRPLWDLVDRGGKRWRAIVCWLSYRAAGGAARGDAVPPAALFQVVELLHNASLAIDDIEDAATERRGGPPVHLAHGLPVALNAANAAYFRALAVLRGILPDAARLRALDMLGDEMFAAHLGQALDLSLGATAKLGVGLEEKHYVALVRAKTGALIRIAARLGAIAADAPEPVERALADWAGHLGVAYQIRDDAEDIAEGSTDLEACRMTYPLLLALASPDPADALRLREQLGDAKPGKAARRARDEIFTRLRVVERSLDAAREAANRATLALATLPAGESRAAMIELTLRLAEIP